MLKAAIQNRAIIFRSVYAPNNRAIIFIELKLQEKHVEVHKNTLIIDFSKLLSL